MDQELPINPEPDIPIEFYKHTNGKLFISCVGLESLMDEILKNAEEEHLEAMSEMRETILQCIDMGKVSGLTDFP